ncbi:MAG: WG repeat-containing protein [Bacteroidales bacterium]|nr:WG repeat-containing protein [Bacteroidales bacterium]MBQ4406524.1 WG repeat-containing protein [Bacteroidales bacterium]
MKRTVISLFLCMVTTLAFALPTDSPVEIVKKFGAEITAWCNDKNYEHQENLLALTSGGENCYINDNIVRIFNNDGTSKESDNICVDAYFDKIGDFVEKGLIFKMSDVQIVNDQDAPKAKNDAQITYVKARLEFNGPLTVKMTNIFWIQNGKIRKTTSDDSRISVACRAFKAKKYDEAFKMFRELAYESFENYDAQYYTALMEIYKLGCKSVFPNSEIRDMEAMVWMQKLFFFCQDSDLSDRARMLLLTYGGLQYAMNPRPTMLFRPMDNNRILYIDPKTKKFGFKDNTGKIVIPCKYEAAFPFHDGVSIAEIGKKYCLINTSGQVITPMFDSMGFIFSGRVYCLNGNTMSLYSTNGKKLMTLEGKYDAISSLLCKYVLLSRPDGGADIFDYSGSQIPAAEPKSAAIEGNKIVFKNAKGKVVESAKLEW